MQHAIVDFWGHLRALTAATLAAWWRSLPAVLTCLCLGFVGYRTALIASAAISGSHAWLAVMLLATGFASLLVGYLGALQALGRQLALGERLLQTNQGESLVDEPLSRLVAITLLPFLGIYAVFGEVQQTSGQLVTYEIVVRGFMADGVLSTLNPTNGHEMAVVAAVLASSYVLRRALDLAHERTGRRLFGLATGLVETFFMLVLIYGGTRMIVTGRGWLAERRAAGWVRDAASSIADVLRIAWPQLPEVIVRAWQALVGPVWQFASQGVMEPLLWLALAALAFGSRVLSVAELCRETLGKRPTRLRAPVARLAQTPRPRLAVAASEVKELFFGDVDDKYLPTIQSLRLVLSAGVSIIGAFALLHALTAGLSWLVYAASRAFFDIAESRLWIALGTFEDLVAMLIAEPVRLALLAVTYQRCLQLIADRPRTEPAPRLAQRLRNHGPSALLAATALVLSGVVVTRLDEPVLTREVNVGVDEPATISRTGQQLRVVALASAPKVSFGKNGRHLTTDGRFLALRIQLSTPGERAIASVRCHLEQDGVQRGPALHETYLLPEPGFRRTYDLAFELPGQHFDGATLVCHPTDLFRSYRPEARVDLGIVDGRSDHLEVFDKPVLLENDAKPEVDR